MKKLFVLVLFPTLLFAEGGMTTKIWQQISKERAQKITPDHCQEVDLDFSMLGKKDVSLFKSTITCQSSCLNGDSKENAIEATFSTEEQEMRRGDGNLWASLTTTIQYWAEEKCIEQSEEYCQSLGGFKDFKVKEVKSGKWKTKLEFTCSKEQKQILSPLGPTAGSELVNMSPEKRKEKNNVRLFNWTNNKDLMHGGIPEVDKSCKVKLVGRLCFGDCITLEGKSVELLSSPAPLGEDDVPFCADSMIAKLKEKKVTSSSLIKHYCDTAFLAYIKKNSVTGLTCASSRFDLDCSAVEKALK